MGQLTHAAALKAAREGMAKMSCLAGVGAQLSEFIDAARDVDQIIVLDGCDQQCAKKIFDQVDLEPHVYLELTKNDFTKEKGVCITDAEVDRAYAVLEEDVERMRDKCV